MSDMAAKSTLYLPKQGAPARRGRRTLLVLGCVTLTGLLGGGYALYRVRQSGQGLRENIKGVVKRVAVTTGIGPAALIPVPPTERADEPLVVYSDGLHAGWDDWSWATHQNDSTAMAGNGSKGIQMQLKGNEGIYFHHAPFNADGYGTLEFLFKGDPSTVMATVFDENNKARRQPVLSSYLVKETSGLKSGWHRVQIPLKVFGVGAGDSISGVVLQCANPSAVGAVGFDDISFLPDTSLPPAPTAVTVAVTVDTKANVHPISPLIYGVAHASKEEVQGMGATLNRWGGNANTRHNWVVNAWNSASDWEFRNHGPEGATATTPGSIADGFVRDSLNSGAVVYMTVPTLGWVARNTDQNTKSENVPWDTGSGSGNSQGATPRYDPTENRKRTSVRSLARKGSAFVENPTSSETVFQDEWIHHLVKAHGSAAGRGVRYYAMDNEPDLWSFTHRDVHPGQLSYDETWQNFIEYATAVKKVDPSALIAGPTVSGWTSFFFSALDRGSDNYKSALDRKSHGGEPFLLWFLKQARSHDQRLSQGGRTLDVLDVHYYPQGQSIYSEAKDPATRALRLRSTRSLWDPTYKDESWIAGTADGPAVRLIPRLKEWIAQGYPGTKLAIGEWSFGAVDDISGGLATAEALGIFGREGVDIAAYWTRPKLGTPSAAAFQLFRRPKAGMVGFGDLSCQASSAQSNQLGVFAATEKATGALTLILINKLPKATMTVPLSVQGHVGKTSRLWRFSSQNQGALVELTGPVLSGGKANLTLPPYSATLVRIGEGN